MFPNPRLSRKFKVLTELVRNRIRTESKRLGQNHTGGRASNQIKDTSGGRECGEGMFEERVRVLGRLTGGTAGDGEQLCGACGHMGRRLTIKDRCVLPVWKITAKSYW